MKRAPQIRLRTLFLIFICAAVGMTIGASPGPIPPDHNPFGIAAPPRTNWSDALLAAASTAMLIGLAHQAQLICRSRAVADSVDQPFTFAIWFAVVWRVLLAALLIVCLLAEMLIARQLVNLPPSNAHAVYKVFPQIVWLCCVLVVLSAAVMRWKAMPEVQRVGPLRFFAIWSVGFGLAAIIYTDLTLITFLVHTATAGINAHIPVHINRQGVFPNHRQEGFQTFWIAFAAVVGALVASASLVSLNAAPQTARRKQWARLAMFATGVAASGTYAIWYYGWEFHRISPDIASVEPASNWVEFMGGALILLILITAGACRLTQMRGKLTGSVNPLPAPTEIFFHESAIAIAVLFGFVGLHVVRVIQNSLEAPAFPFFAGSFGQTLLYVFRDVLNLIMLGVGILSAQLGWLRWRRRGELTDIRIASMNGKTFCLNWVALALLLGVGIPTAAAFAFVMWLGPWWLFG